MKQRSSEELACPAGLDSCHYWDELVSLRQQVEQLETLVHTDTLTELPNYRYFRLVLDQEMARCRRSGRPLTLAMVDIDHFKQVNDRFGHEAGNTALRRVAASLRQAVRKIDTACRYGGEEFVILLPESDLEQSVLVAERLRERVANTPVYFGEQRIDLSVSVGLSVYQATQHCTAEALIHEADSQLYRAKQQGRNRVMHAPLPSAKAPVHVSQDEKDALAGLFDE